MELNKQDQKLFQELLKKYKVGLISGLIEGDNITFTPTGCRNKIISSTGGGGTSYIPPYLKTGGASWSGTGLVYDVSGLEYYFNGDKLAAATQVTLDASDPDDNRLDAIVVDEEGVVSVIKGDASASPISPSVDELHILIQYILVEAGSTQPTIAKEDIYLENAEWTTSTYTTGAATGSIDFDNAVSPKQGVKCISANADARLGARFVRTTSFDPYQYTMLSMWVRFTGSNVDTNKSLNVRFENGAGTLVANTINLFNFGLQRNLLNVWQLVVIPITSFGALPTSVKGLKIIMTGGTVGQARQWDIDLISLTDNSVPSINEQAFNILKDGALVGQSSSLNFKGASVNVTNDNINNKIDVEVIGGGGDTLLFPNGVKLVLSSRDFQADDKDYILYCAVPNIVLSMPETNPFSEGDYVGVVMSSPDSYFETYNNGSGGTDKIYPYTQNPSGTTLEQQSSSEVVILRATNTGSVKLLPLSGAVKESVDINGSNFKTLARHNYDKSQNAIPLSGTVSGSPVTGDIEGTDSINIKTKNYASSNNYNSLTLFGDAVRLSFDDSVIQTSLTLSQTLIEVNCNNSGSRGLIGAQDFTANITDLDYPQKIYVGFRGTATLSSGTVTVATDKIKTGYKIYLSVNTPSGTQGFLSAPTGSIVDETEFVINSTSATDDSTVNWWIAP